MKRLIYTLILGAALVGARDMRAQSSFPLTVEVSATTGVSTQGLVVELSGEDSGWVFDPVKVKADGTARFSYVPAGVFTLVVDGTPLGLERYVDTELLHEGEQTVSVVLSEAVRTPYALQAVLGHDDFSGEESAVVSWNRETDYFFDDFESYEPFAVEFAPWTGHDLDREPAAEIQGGYPNRGTQQYATIFNALTIDPPVYYEYEVLRPYSGKQYVGFVRTRSGNANNDWLISPKIKVGVDNIVSFMAKASEYTPDRFAVCISTTGTEVGDFQQLTAGNYETVDYKQWHEIVYSLARWEGQEVYIAIHCMSQNSFMLMVDDFYVGPQTVEKKARRVGRGSAANPNERFTVTLDGVKAGETEDYSFALRGLAPGSHTVGVQASYVEAVSDVASIDIEVPGADSYASLKVKLTSEIDFPVEGTKISLLNTGNARSTTLTADEDGEAEAGFLAKGTYMVNVETAVFEPYNDVVELDGDKELTIALDENVTDPFNVLWQVSPAEDGSFVAEFSWNQDLGFRDSFEEYEDFTQEIGDWTVYDLDDMPTYAFSIAGTIIEWPVSREPIGAMVFNPYSTLPVQASMDGLFIAPDGDKYVMFSSAESAESNDWLISPTLRIGEGYVLRFTAKSYDFNYPGAFDICVLKEKDIAHPDVLDSFWLTNEWMRYEIPLSGYEGTGVEIGFHHASYDGWLSFVDDVYVGPGDESSAGDTGDGRSTFDIFLDGDFCFNVSQPCCTLEGLAPGTHTVGIQAVYPSGRRSEVVETVLTIGESGAVTIEDNGFDSGEGWRYFDLNGREIPASSLPHGVFIRSNGNAAQKIVR